MASRRIERLNEQLKREISELIRTRVRDHRVGVVTITDVEVARDLGSARVFVRSLGDTAERAETLAGLTAAAPFLRHELGQFLRVRMIPELRFHEDQSLQHARRIDAILHEVMPEVMPEDGDPEGEATPEEARETDGASE